MGDWMVHVAVMLYSHVELIAKAMHTDATKMLYLDPEVPGRSLASQMWAFGTSS